MHTTGAMLLAMTTMAIAAGCGGRHDDAPPPPRAPETPLPVEQPYRDKVEAIRRLLKAGELDAGLKAAQALYDDHRVDAEGLTVIATAYQVTGDAKEALNVARAATQKDPQYAPAWIAIGAAERATGGFTDAEAALRRALELDPKSRAARFDLAGIAADKGQHDVAAEQLRALLATDPDDFETAYLLATELLAKQDVDGAKAQLTAIVQRYPEHYKAQRTLALLAWAEGDYKKAFQRATIAARLSQGAQADGEISNVLEGSFYIVAAARLTCQAGPRPWAPDKVVAVLTRLEKDEGLDGAASFVDLDDKYGEQATVQARIAKAVADAGCAVTPKPQ